MKVSVIIVNYNSREYLAQNLVQLFASPKPAFLDTEVIIVDNHSQDGSVEFVRAKFPEAIVLAQESNLGFGAGCNRGSKQATGEYLYFLNPDAQTTWEDIGHAVKYLAQNKEAGIVGSAIADWAGQPQGSFGYEPSFSSEISESLYLGRLGGGRVIWPRFYNRRLFTEKHAADWVGGAGMAVRKNLYERLNGFDEKFFLYFEDVDLCVRLRQIGYKVMYLPVSKVRHYQGASADSNISAAFRNSRNAYIEKHFTGSRKALGTLLWPTAKISRNGKAHKINPALAYTRYEYEAGALRRLKYFLKTAGKKRREILEVGAGAGNITLPLARLGHRLTALEPHPPTAAELKKYRRLFDLEVITQNIEEYLKTAEKKFDVIVVSEVLEHLTKPGAVVRQLKKVLKDDGLIVGSVPARNSLDEIGRWFLAHTLLGRAIKKPLKEHVLERGVQSAAESPHVQFFSLSKIKALFEDNELNIQELKTSTVFFRECYYVIGRFFLKRGGKIFKIYDRLDQRWSRAWPSLFAAGWMFKVSKK